MKWLFENHPSHFYNSLSVPIIWAFGGKKQRSHCRSETSGSDTQSWILIEFIDNEDKKWMIGWKRGLRGYGWASFSLSVCFCLSIRLCLPPGMFQGMFHLKLMAPAWVPVLRLRCVTLGGIHLFSEPVQSQLTSARTGQHLNPTWILAMRLKTNWDIHSSLLTQSSYLLSIKQC